MAWVVGVGPAGSVALGVRLVSGHAWAVVRPVRSRPVLPPRPAFVGFRFPSEVIVLAVRLYLRYGLSYRDVEELLVERGVEVDHVTVNRWVQRFTPLLALEFVISVWPEGRPTAGEVLTPIGYGYSFA